MTVFLVARDGPLAGRRIPVEDGLVIGREADLVVDDPEISRRHAIIHFRGTEPSVEDLASRNGTWVNDARVVGETALRDGDILRVGPVRFAIEGVALGAETKVGSPASAAARLAVPDTPFSPPSPRREVGIATRLVSAEIATWIVILGTSAALIFYFALRY